MARKKKQEQRQETRHSDIGTPELRQHHAVEMHYGHNEVKHARVVTQMPHDYMLHRDWITDSQWQAADYLYRDYVIAGLPPAITAALGVVGGGGNTDVAAFKIDGWRRIQSAIESVRGREQQRLVIYVICFGERVMDIEQMRVVKPRQGMVLLRQALDDLVKFYGITKCS